MAISYSAPAHGAASVRWLCVWPAIEQAVEYVQNASSSAAMHGWRAAAHRQHLMCTAMVSSTERDEIASQ